MVHFAFMALLCTLSCGHYAFAYVCTDIGPNKVFYDPACSTGESIGCNAGGEGQNCRFCWAAPVKCQHIASSSSTVAQTTTTQPDFLTTPFSGQCHPVNGHQTFYDTSCATCNAGNQNLNCRYCGDDIGIPCPKTEGSTTSASNTPILPTLSTPTVAASSVTTSPSRTTHTTQPVNRCSDPATAMQQTPCIQSELQNCMCNDNTYCCLQGNAVKGCSGVAWTAPACSCACEVVPMPIPNCTYEIYLFAPCADTAPFYCPSTNGCGGSKYACPDLCYLTPVPPYPARPPNGNNFTPSNQLIPQNATCGAQGIPTQSNCVTQPSDPSWTHAAQRQQQCQQNGWWCPNGAGWTPSKYQCGATMSGNDSLCPISNLQTEACEMSKPYAAPSWAPQPKTASTYCDTTCDCDNITVASHCVGCCLWDNPNLKCKSFWEVGNGAACRQVSPRFNWIITTCDSMGGIDFGGACRQNPFSTVDVRYIAAYQLAKDNNGNFLWQVVPESSLNTKGEKKYVDFSSLPTEHTGTGPIRSCSGGGGDWNAAYFPYKVDGVTPPAMMFVLSYERFENAAFFMLNQRILNGGPDISTCKDMTNCWGEISAGEIDFLETPNLFPSKFQNEQGWSTYRLTSYNAANRCFACNHAYQDGSKNIAGCGGEPANSWYNGFAEAADPQPHVWAVVIDARGTTVYKDPVWPGITASCAADTLINLHPAQPQQNQPCQDPTKTCAMYLPSCVTASSERMTLITGGDYSRIPYCFYVDAAVSTTCTENWWNLMMDTGQWVVADPQPWGV